MTRKVVDADDGGVTEVCGTDTLVSRKQLFNRCVTHVCSKISFGLHSHGDSNQWLVSFEPGF